MLGKLRRAGVAFESVTAAPRSDKLAGKTFVITGSLETMTRNQAERAIVPHGGRATGIRFEKHQLRHRRPEPRLKVRKGT